eukprot:7748678-Alexandrium_andersonii.AAC.1
MAPRFYGRVKALLRSIARALQNLRSQAVSAYAPDCVFQQSASCEGVATEKARSGEPAVSRCRWLAFRPPFAPREFKNLRA